MEIMLASTSPRRRMLLRKFWKIRCVRSRFPEKMLRTPEETVAANALGKAEEVATRYKGKIVVGADTVVYSGKILGKPKNKKEAEKILKKISGKWIKVYGGIAVVKDQLKEVKVVVTKVKMKRMGKKDIKNYIATGEPLDKAGAFGAQGIGALLIERIEGDYFNVVGISLFTLNEMLNKFKKKER
ncbi:MAG: Maf family protein [Candidatus Anstonellales archaeon]